MRLYWDIETDGLLDNITTIHCIAIKQEGKPAVGYGPNQLDEAIALLDTATELVSHNGIAFDHVAMWKVLRWRAKPGVKIVDTFLLAQLLQPDILGGNSLEACGKRVGVHKAEYAGGWETYSPEMLAYCVQDVVTLEAIHHRLLRDMEGKNFRKALSMEHAFAKEFAVQGLHGVWIDQPHARTTLASIEREMSEIEQEVTPLLPSKAANKGELAELTPPKILFKKNGEPSSHCLAFCAKHGIQPSDITPGTPIRSTVDMQLKDDEAIKGWLMDQGWCPSFWNFKKQKDARGKLRVVRGDDGQPVPSSPKYTSDGALCPHLQSIIDSGEVDPSVAKVARWVVLRHRAGLVKGVLSRLRPDGRVSATGFSLGTPTSRVRHVAPVCNIPKADPKVIYGKEMRAMFAAPKGRVIVGVDAAGIELRCLAHYANNPAATELILQGDIHQALADAYARVVPTVTRSSGKNITYGYLYGSGDEKAGLTAGVPKAKAKAAGAGMREGFIKAIPGLDRLMEQIELAAKRGYITALDGREIEIRSKHATLNTLLQSCGSILVKWGTVKAVRSIREKGLRARMVWHYHDELGLEAHPADAVAAGEEFIKGLQWAANYLGFRVPLDGEVKVGRTWADVH